MSEIKAFLLLLLFFSIIAFCLLRPDLARRINDGWGFRIGNTECGGMKIITCRPKD